MALKPKFFLPLLAWCALIFCLSHQPNLDLQHLAPAWSWSDLLDKPLRKLGHVAEYAILYMLARRGWRAWPSLLFCAVFAASDEWHQTFVPGRMGRVSDWALDTASAGVMKYLWRRMENC